MKRRAFILTMVGTAASVVSACSGGATRVAQPKFLSVNRIASVTVDTAGIKLLGPRSNFLSASAVQRDLQSAVNRQLVGLGKGQPVELVVRVEAAFLAANINALNGLTSHFVADVSAGSISDDTGILQGDISAGWHDAIRPGVLNVTYLEDPAAEYNRTVLGFSEKLRARLLKA